MKLQGYAFISYLICGHYESLRHLHLVKKEYYRQIGNLQTWAVSCIIGQKMAVPNHYITVALYSKVDVISRGVYLIILEKFHDPYSVAHA